MALFEWTLALLLGAVILTGLARRVGVPYPSLLAIAGAALAFAPAGPELEIEPDLALALFVTPVLLDAAFDTSPRDLRRNVIPLASLVVVAVGLTTAAVAWVGWRLGGLPIAAAVALGAIVAPPDAAATAAVFGRLRLPRRILHVLQGESLMNDATALLVYRIAVGAAVGTITLGHTGPIVALMAVGSPIVGWLLARLYLLGTARVRDAASSTVLTFVGTFGVWLLAERVGLSPIITMVTYGMALAREAPRRVPARNRISTYSVWETVVFVLNVLAFVIMGLQARPILNRLSRESLVRALLVSGAVLATVIVVRIAYVMAYSTIARLKNRWFGVALTPGTAPPTVAGGLLVSWCGMRGLVTLATAFALPPGFPGRDLIVLSAFCVVLGTLVIQGFTLRPLLDRLGFEAVEQRPQREALDDERPQHHAERGEDDQVPAGEPRRQRERRRERDEATHAAPGDEQAARDRRRRRPRRQRDPEPAVLQPRDRAVGHHVRDADDDHGREHGAAHEECADKALARQAVQDGARLQAHDHEREHVQHEHDRLPDRIRTDAVARGHA